MTALTRTVSSRAALRRASTGRLAVPNHARSLNIMITPTQPAKQSTVTACDSTPVRRLRTISSSPPTAAFPRAPTVDCAVFPSISEASASRESIRVPYLPDTFTRMTSSAQPTVPEAGDEAVFRAQISTVAHESTHLHPPSALSDVVDNGAISIDPYDLATKVRQAARQLGEKVSPEGSKEPGQWKQVWAGLLDDVFGRPSGLKPV